MAAQKPAEPQPQDKNKIDDYQLISVIATGKMSQVWEVLNEQSGQKFAMKLLLPEAMKEPDEIELLKHEGKLAQTFEHPVLNRCYGVVSRKTECYLLLELFKTPNIKQWLHNNVRAVQARLPRIVEQVCHGLGYMHDKGWVHKDIKPDNILLNRSDEVRIIDFSLAVKKATGLSKLFASKRGVIRGTRSYLAPETIRKEPSTPATDIYSLGIVFYEILTGTVPFKGENPQELLAKHISAVPAPPSFYNKNVTPEMDALVAKMLAKKPTARPQTCQEVLNEFNKIQAFKEPVSETADAAAKQAAAESPQDDELKKLLATRLSSKDDAKLQELLRQKPELMQVVKDERARKEADKKKTEAELRLRAEKEELKKKGAVAEASTTPQPAPLQPAMPPPLMAPMAGYGMPPQGMPMPYGMPPQPIMPYGMPQPGMPMPGMSPYAPQPGFPQQMMPGMYATGMIPPGYPMQPGMPPNPVQTPSPATRPGTQPPQKIQKPTPAKSPIRAPQTNSKDADLPVMTELPEIE